MAQERDLQAYWSENIKYVLILLTVWFSVSYLAGIVFADDLDKIMVGGFPLGFWFANQGAEITFVILIVIYVKLMNALDRKYDVHEE